MIAVGVGVGVTRVPGVGSDVAVPTSAILLVGGDYLLLTDGSKILMS